MAGASRRDNYSAPSFLITDDGGYKQGLWVYLLVWYCRVIGPHVSLCQGLKSSLIYQATRRPIFHSRFEQKKIVVAQHRPNIRQNPGGEMQKLLRDGSKKHSDPAKASFPVGDSMCACAV